MYSVVKTSFSMVKCNGSYNAALVVSMFYFKQDVDFNNYILLCIHKNVDIKFTAHDAFLE